MASFTFISPVSSSIVAPAVTHIARDLSISSETEKALVFSLFVLGYAIGPLFLGPLFEIFSRVLVLQLANLFYLIFNSTAGWSTNKSEMVAFRLLSGLGGSAPLAIGGGVLGDMWSAEERGAALSMYSLAPLVGPAIRPVAGGFIAEYTTWRWVFWAPSIANIVVQVLGVFYLQETYGPHLLNTKVRRMRKETGNLNLQTEFDVADRRFSSTLKRALVRPFVLLGTRPIIQILALYMAYLYGVYCKRKVPTFMAKYRDCSAAPLLAPSLHSLNPNISQILSPQLSPWFGKESMTSPSVSVASTISLLA